MKHYLLLAIAFIFIYLSFVKKLIKGKWWFFSLFFLLTSPWFIQLLLSGFELFWFKPLVVGINDFIESLIINSSSDYLFFRGDPRVNFGTQETGLFYIFQIPLIGIGFYALFSKLDKYKKILLAWFLLGFLIASLFASSPDFSNGLFYFLPLQIISFLGLVSVFRNWQTAIKFKRALILLFFLFAAYEMIIFFHILVVHYPKRLLMQ